MGNESEKNADHERQTTELYAALGKFVVQFEMVVARLSTIVMDGLTPDLSRQMIVNAVIGNMTADPLRSAALAVTAELRPQMSDAERKVVQKLFGRIASLISDRNNLLHRTWYVGYAYEGATDYSRAIGWKFSPGKKGAGFAPLVYTKEDFNKHTEDAEDLVALLAKLQGALFFNGEITDYLEFDAQDRLRIRESE